MASVFRTSLFLALSTVLGLAQAAAPATLTLTFDFPGSMPEHYVLGVQSDGKASYESRSKIMPESDETDSFRYECAISQATSQKIFDLAAKADYFRKDLDSHKKNMAFTGKKTLAYKDSEHSGESTYVYSPNVAVQELTTLLESVAGTLEVGHKLEYAHRYQKLALDDELKSLEKEARSSFLTEMQAIAPILQQIIDDHSVMNVSRSRAQRILAMGGG